MLSIEGSKKLCPQNRHILGICGADEKVAFVSTGAAPHTDIHKELKAAKPVEPILEPIRDDLFPVFGQLV